MPARDRLNPIEQYLAYLIGLGIVLAIIAMLLIGFGSGNDDSATAMLLVGLAVTAIGVGAWLFLVRPWTEFDDLKTPYYTGHEDHVAEPHISATGMGQGVPAPPEQPESATDARLGGTVPASPSDVEDVLETEPAGEVLPPPTEPETAFEARLGDAIPAEPATLEDEPAGALEEELDAALETESDTALEGALDAALAAEADVPLGDAAPAESVTVPSEDAVAADVTTGAEAADVLETGVDAALATESDSALEDALDEALAAEADRGEPESVLVGEPEPGAATPVERDDLLMIEGLGPKSQEVLYAAGITTFRAVADSTPETLADLIRTAGLRLVRAETWPQQAALLAAEDFAGFEALRGTLRGGRRT